MINELCTGFCIDFVFKIKIFVVTAGRKFNYNIYYFMVSTGSFWKNFAGVLGLDGSLMYVLNYLYICKASPRT